MKKFIKSIKDVYHYKDLLGQLVLRDLKLKYRRSVLGYLWSVLNPLMIMMVMVVVFSNIFNRSIENYPVYLLTGQVMFNFMNQSTHQALLSITGNGSLMKKTYVPKYIFTLSKVTSGLLDYVFSIGALIVVMLFTGTKFTPYFLTFPLIAIQLYIFNLGLGLFLSQAAVFFRDIQYIYSVITTAWLYLTPIFYPIESLSSDLQRYIKLFNPMYYYIQEFRMIVLYGSFPPTDLFVGGVLCSIVMLLIGSVFFIKNQNKFILYI